MEAEPFPRHVLPPCELDPECARLLHTIQTLFQARASPWLGLVELRQALNMPLRQLDPHLVHLVKQGFVVVRHHNPVARASRYATLRALARSVALAGTTRVPA